jgi:hypothetical protein
VCWTSEGPTAAPVTESAHEKTDTVIEAAASRQNSYYLVAFKPGTGLDNSIFSSNNTIVERKQNGMKLESNDGANGFNKKIRGMGFMAWACGGEFPKNLEDKANKNPTFMLL